MYTRCTLVGWRLACGARALSVPLSLCALSLSLSLSLSVPNACSLCLSLCSLSTAVCSLCLCFLSLSLSVLSLSLSLSLSLRPTVGSRGPALPYSYSAAVQLFRTNTGINTPTHEYRYVRARSSGTSVQMRSIRIHVFEYMYDPTTVVTGLLKLVLCLSSAVPYYRS